MQTHPPRRQFRPLNAGYGAFMERTDLYQDDLTEERLPTPADREENSHTIALDPNIDADADDMDDEDDDEDEGEDVDA